MSSSCLAPAYCARPDSTNKYAYLSLRCNKGWYDRLTLMLMKKKTRLRKAEKTAAKKDIRNIIALLHLAQATDFHDLTLSSLASVHGHGAHSSIHRAA